VKKIIILIISLTFLMAPVLSQNLQPQGKISKVQKLKLNQGSKFDVMPKYIGKGLDREKFKKYNILVKAIGKLQQVAIGMKNKGKTEEAQQLFKRINELRLKLQAKRRSLEKPGQEVEKGKDAQETNKEKGKKGN